MNQLHHGNQTPSPYKDMKEFLRSAMLEQITYRCQEHKFPLLHEIHTGFNSNYETRRTVTLNKLKILNERTLAKEPDDQTAFMLSVIFEHVIQMIESRIGYNHKVVMLSVEGVELFNAIAHCTSAEGLRRLVEKHPIFPTGEE